MALSNHKITDAERNTQYVKSTPGTRLTGSVAENKNVFDKYPELIRTKLNALIDDLISKGMDKAVSSPDDIWIRIGSNNVLEVSHNKGTTWEKATYPGHSIYDGQGNAFPQRTRMKFENTVINDDGTYTIVHGIKGDKGDQGDTGFSPTITANKVGKTTTVTVTDSEGTHTFEIRDGEDGEGSGDMRTEYYDPDEEVLEAGGIPAYMSGKEDTSNKVTSIGSGSTDTQYPSAKAVNTAVSAKYTASNASATERGLIKYKQGNFIINASGFSPDSTYADYPFRKDITVSGCTADHFADVAFDLESATSGILAPVANTHSGGIYVYAKEQPSAMITGSYKITYNA